MMLCVAICTRNRPQQLADCLHSLEASGLVDEVIVSSDGSDDETEMVARSVAGKFRHFSFLRGPRCGLAANRNNCIAAVRSAYVLFLDDDAATVSILRRGRALGGRSRPSGYRLGTAQQRESHPPRPGFPGLPTASTERASEGDRDQLNPVPDYLPSISGF